MATSWALGDEVGFAAGAAANLVGLTYICAARGELARAAQYDHEAAEAARAVGALKVLADAEAALESITG